MVSTYNYKQPQSQILTLEFILVYGIARFSYFPVNDAQLIQQIIFGNQGEHNQLCTLTLAALGCLCVAFFGFRIRSQLTAVFTTSFWFRIGTVPVPLTLPRITFGGTGSPFAPSAIPTINRA